jgi:3-methyladenine DNA glycosylase AlkD
MIETPARAAAVARRQLEALARPSGEFDASRYFRSDHDLGFHNIGARTVRQMAKGIVGERREQWRVTDALAFADRLIRNRHLETKGLGIEALACYRKQFTAELLPVWKRWLAANHAANWATTDAICGYLAGPLLVAEPQLVRLMPSWARDKNLWVRRASAVSLIPSVRKGLAIDTAYRVAGLLHGDRDDLIQKAVGWMLREAGKSDPARLERYLRANGPSIPRTTLRYAIERFPPDKRRDLLATTRTAPEARVKPRAR